MRIEQRVLAKRLAGAHLQLTLHHRPVGIVQAREQHLVHRDPLTLLDAISNVNPGRMNRGLLHAGFK